MVTEFGFDANRDGPVEERGTYAFQVQHDRLPPRGVRDQAVPVGRDVLRASGLLRVPRLQRRRSPAESALQRKGSGGPSGPARSRRSPRSLRYSTDAADRAGRRKSRRPPSGSVRPRRPRACTSLTSGDIPPLRRHCAGPLCTSVTPPQAQSSFRSPAGRCRSSTPGSARSTCGCARDAGVFDVSHMGQVETRGPRARRVPTADAVQRRAPDSRGRRPVQPAVPRRRRRARRPVHLPAGRVPLRDGHQRRQPRQAIWRGCRSTPRSSTSTWSTDAPSTRCSRFRDLAPRAWCRV